MNTIEEIKLKVKAGYRLIGLETRDDAASDEAVSAALTDGTWTILHYDHSLGGKDGLPVSESENLAEFLRDCKKRTDKVLALVLRNVSEELSHPEVMALVKSILLAGWTEGDADVLIIVTGRSVCFRLELGEYATIVTMGLPCEAEIVQSIGRFCLVRGLTPCEDDRRLPCRH